MKDNDFCAFPSMNAMGMSMRDYFAGQALAGLMANLASDEFRTWEDGARICYMMADVMLKERAKGEEK